MWKEFLQLALPGGDWKNLAYPTCIDFSSQTLWTNGSLAMLGYGDTSHCYPGIGFGGEANLAYLREGRGHKAERTTQSVRPTPSANVKNVYIEDQWSNVKVELGVYAINCVWLWC